jgi:hypothetical protein
MTVKRREAIELTALRIFNRADGIPVTRDDVCAALAAWREHPESCDCGCDVARPVTVSQVWQTIRAWQESIMRTRRLARR